MDADVTQILSRPGEFVDPWESDVPLWESGARNRLSATVDRLAGPIADLEERDANEGDTRFLVTDFLSDGLGYSKYEDLTTEYRTKGESVDYGLKIGDSVFALVEVKRAAQNLDARNLRQVRLSAENEGVQWLVLTNGRVWQVHHLAEGAAGTELVLEVDLLGDAEKAEKLDGLFHLSKAAVEHGRLENLRKWREALTGAPLAAAVCSEAVVEAVRAEVRRRTGHTGHAGDVEDVLRGLREEVVAKGLLD
ncbi:hypothetical protein [Nocardiopsis ansamitocini]|uniref:Type I restriction enzyme R protein N-terminal domain-containing protein n=1 Tax=Nocardiopsis ansamitocini TaxID=1670832 RepID=A0A9W6P3L2_9ACTN|nr:hypothetical protein [Nocardiopsis ansamitocini]GLU46541.1 hypothetical protein Nans01_08920 [Nocardiopsis ansamitocini]